MRAVLLGMAGDPGRPVGGYVFDPGVAAARAERLRAALPDWARVCYSVKANSYPPVLDALASRVDGFEVASAAEVDLARAAGPGHLLVASGPGKSLPTLRRILEREVDLINVDSPLELARVDRAARELGVEAAVAVRVNPRRVDLVGSLAMGGAATQFGVSEQDVPAVLAAAARYPSVRVTGFHVHAVCNNLDAEAQADYVRWCLEWSTRTAARHGVPLAVVDVGGGLGVPFEGERPFDLARFGELLARIRPPAGCMVIFEPGRYLVAEAGWYAAEVLDVKHTYGTRFVVLRGGINHFQLPTSWDIRHRFAVLPVDAWPYDCPRPAATGVPVTVVGELCTPEDTLARDVTVDRARAGDLVVFPMAGSYGYEFAMPLFLGHPPAERWVVGQPDRGGAPS
ncbi:alanine racemase [Actinophytocola sp.]|uniref:alanine racemase n=1 Tax=Actinophytocola sp. TaxID=1872138 RepID=UPI002DDD9FC0|nr:alanine racemase [Actinophytocola sp.]